MTEAPSSLVPSATISDRDVPRLPQVSLINSASASGLLETKMLVDQLGLKHVDLYAFMNDDLRLLWPLSQVKDGFPKNALYEMAAALDHPHDIARIAGVIEEKIAPAKVAAFATYLPEITSPYSSKFATEAAQKALQFVVLLATELNRRGHPVITVEIVSGSVVDGLWLGKTRNGTATYIVNRLDEQESISRLVDNLQPVVKFAVDRNSPIRLAVELEPGPLFNLNSRESLLTFCNLLQAKGADFKRVVGLNLDIPHWSYLANISATWVEEHPLILDRIIHAHISDHSRGHFCDLEAMVFHGSSDLIPWLRLLAKRANNPQAPEFSNFIACEMECSCNIKHIRKSLDCLQDMINRYCQ